MWLIIIQVWVNVPSITHTVVWYGVQGQLDVAATAGGTDGVRALRLPGYVASLGARFLTTMRKGVQNKTYAQVGGC